MFGIFMFAETPKIDILAKFKNHFMKKLLLFTMPQQ